MKNENSGTIWLYQYHSSFIKDNWQSSMMLPMLGPEMAVWGEGEIGKNVPSLKDPLTPSWAKPVLTNQVRDGSNKQVAKSIVPRILSTSLGTIGSTIWQIQDKIHINVSCLNLILSGSEELYSINVLWYFSQQAWICEPFLPAKYQVTLNTGIGHYLGTICLS